MVQVEDAFTVRYRIVCVGQDAIGSLELRGGDVYSGEVGVRGRFHLLNFENLLGHAL